MYISCECGRRRMIFSSCTLQFSLYNESMILCVCVRGGGRQFLFFFLSFSPPPHPHLRPRPPCRVFSACTINNRIFLHMNMHETPSFISFLVSLESSPSLQHSFMYNSAHNTTRSCLYLLFAFVSLSLMLHERFLHPPLTLNSKHKH